MSIIKTVQWRKRDRDKERKKERRTSRKLYLTSVHDRAFEFEFQANFAIMFIGHEGAIWWTNKLRVTIRSFPTRLQLHYCSNRIALIQPSLCVYRSEGISLPARIRERPLRRCFANVFFDGRFVSASADFLLSVCSLMLAASYLTFRQPFKTRGHQFKDTKSQVLQNKIDIQNIILIILQYDNRFDTYCICHTWMDAVIIPNQYSL